MHVALTSQRVVHSEGCCQTMAGVTACAQLQVFAQQRLVVGMSTVLDDELCTLHRALAAQVGDTLFRYDDVDIVLRVVLMADKGNDLRDEAALCR